MQEMSKEIFKKTEGKLYRYYETKKYLRGLDSKIAKLIKDKETIEYDIRHTNIRIDIYQNGTGISERVQTSSDGSGYAEKEMIKEIDKLEKELVKVTKQILKNKAKKREMENYINNIEFNINMLNEESKRFLELKYSDKAGPVAIAQKMNMAVATVYRIRGDIVRNVADFMKIIV